MSDTDDLLQQVRELAIFVRRQDLTPEERVIRDRIMRRMEDVMPAINSLLLPLTQSDTSDKEE